ncbi:DUF333 domain-containing protein [Candidatus Kirkpatrickella diaphorinae]|uniref:DUF333 domain-containing protein n=1 Tax=Candidatus Kirkpatrickella diaphorinae TaxID=2984322 RepID=A0ABY6GHJ2_9PROT|nr:DUF333 domain-containing protein [Candidatus Kirkpatrickella diaphorinae]UYH50990.1 DUF333 domain-containing protein [Candidatus Kirkpatrickella diaphorinae]
MSGFSPTRLQRDKVFTFRRTAIIGVALAAPLLAACSHEDFLLSNARTGMSNPASTYCIQKGGGLQMVRDEKGVHALCHLPDGRIIEAWDLFRQDHPTQNQGQMATTPAQPDKSGK